MPELPDLEVISANLGKRFNAKKLSKINIFKDKKLNAPSAEFEKKLESQNLNNVQRSGKELLLEFTNGNYLGIHLMLKGEIHLLEEDNVKGKVFELVFEDGSGFSVTDFMAQAKPILNPEKSEVPDALDLKFDFDYLKSKFAKANKANVKKILKDQEIVRGIGNAYIDEILWEAKISPLSIGSKIPDKSIKILVEATKNVLRNAIEQIKAQDPDIISGEIRSFLKIHTTTKDKSPTGAKINVIEIDSKKTYFTDEQELYE